jgi:tRNA pseudouridine55 synthase
LTDGIILLDKPAGRTSFQSLGELKRRLGTGRVGHTGTLDKFAQGLLVVLAGRMTRLCAFATALDKEYTAEVTFGRTTDTLDPEGAVTTEGPVPGLEELRTVLPGFLGESLQVPPAFSALHVNGRRAYEAARAGEMLVLAPRPVTISALQLVSWSPPAAVLRVACSKGTYVRSLARDIAEQLGTVAYLTGLRRTRVGGFRIEDAVSPDDFDPSSHVLSPALFFKACPSLGTVTLTASAAAAAAHGRPPTPGFFASEPAQDGTYGAFSPGGDLVAVMDRSGGNWTYAAVFGPGEDRS